MHVEHEGALTMQQCGQLRTAHPCLKGSSAAFHIVAATSDDNNHGWLVQYRSEVPVLQPFIQFS